LHPSFFTEEFCGAFMLTPRPPRSQKSISRLNNQTSVSRIVQHEVITLWSPVRYGIGASTVFAVLCLFEFHNDTHYMHVNLAISKNQFRIYVTLCL
jgi:hypothetical protein